MSGPKRIVGGWHRIVGVLTKNKEIRLYVDGERIGEGEAPSLLTKDPAQLMKFGTDDGGAVGGYESPFQFVGIIDEVRLYFKATDDGAVAERFKDGAELFADPVLVVSSDDGTAGDMSLGRNNGTLNGGKVVTGKIGQAMQFTGKGGGVNNVASGKGMKGKPVAAGDENADAKAKPASEPRNSIVEPKWTTDVPICVRAMVMAGFHLYIVGPPEFIDEEATFQKISEKDAEVQTLSSDRIIARIRFDFAGSRVGGEIHSQCRRLMGDAGLPHGR